MKTKYIIYAAIILVIGFLVYKRFAGSNIKEPTGPKNTAGISVKGIVVEPRSFANNLTIAGSIEANEAIEIRSEISGLVKNIYFNEGALVKKGAILLTINDAELQAQLSQATTSQKLSAQNENRAKQLLEKEAISQEEYDSSLADLNTRKAEVQLARALLSKTVIRAPFSGRVGLRNISVGSYVTPTTNIARLANTNPVKISFSVPEKYANMLKENSKISFSVAGNNKKYEAQIYAVEPTIDVTSRTLMLRARAANPNNILIPGQFADINLALASVDNALLVPTQSVIPFLNGKKLFIVKGGKAKEISVQATTRTDSLLLITEGIKSGDTVLTTGMMALKDGTAVNVTLQKAPK